MLAKNIRTSARAMLGNLSEYSSPFEGGSARDLRAEIPSRNGFVGPNPYIPNTGYATGAPRDTIPKQPCCQNLKPLLVLVAVAWLVASL